MSSLIRPGMICFDVGAHVGYYSLLLAKLGADVYAFEPNPINTPVLERHLALNHCSATILDIALTDRAGMATFDQRPETSMGRLADCGQITVKCSTLDHLWKTGIVPTPAAIKVDIEGEEFRFICGASELLQASRPILFLATHYDDSHRACLSRLAEYGYSNKLIGTDPHEFVCTPNI
jgi:FkbM family methyltransferase